MRRQQVHGIDVYGLENGLDAEDELTTTPDNDPDQYLWAGEGPCSGAGAEDGEGGDDGDGGETEALDDEPPRATGVGASKFEAVLRRAELSKGGGGVGRSIAALLSQLTRLFGRIDRKPLPPSLGRRGIVFAAFVTKDGRVRVTQ